MAPRKQNVSKKEQLFKRLFYDPKKPGSLSGVNALHDAAITTNKNKRIKISKDDVKKFLQSQDTYTMHKLPRINFTRRRVIVGGPREQFQCDLVDMSKHASENKNYKWILVVIDVFTKKAWAQPVKSKQSVDIISAFKNIFSDVGKPLPDKLQSDKGMEFRARPVLEYFKNLNIKWFSSQDDATKASVVERLNRTLKKKMYMKFYAQNNKKWLDMLPDLLEGYNKTVHSSIKMSPEMADSMDSERVETVRNNLYGPTSRLNTSIKKEIKSPASTEDFKVGDHVRIVKHRMAFVKSYLPNFKDEVFVIDDIYNQIPKVYHLKDLDDEEIKGWFYGTEIQKVKKPDLFKVEEVLETKGDKVFVKWLGYGPKFNSWIHKKALKSF